MIMNKNIDPVKLIKFSLYLLLLKYLAGFSLSSMTFLEMLDIGCAWSSFGDSFEIFGIGIGWTGPLEVNFLNVINIKPIIVKQQHMIIMIHVNLDKDFKSILEIYTILKQKSLRRKGLK